MRCCSDAERQDGAAARACRVRRARHLRAQRIGVRRVGVAGHGCQRGQATVEAAFLMPVILLAMLLLAQPAIILYDRAVMEAAAAEGCRMLETLAPGDEDAARAAVERRLDAIPDAPIFHSGGWTIELSGGEGREYASVRIEHALEPLPLMGAGMGLLGLTGPGGLFTHDAFRQTEVVDAWVVESCLGADAEAWIGRWEEKA